MARYIDADKAIERLNASPAFGNMGTDGYFLLDVVKDLLNRLPTLNVAIVKHGEWIDTVTGYACSICHTQEPAKRFLYCPNCGAKMDGKEDEGK